jgi:hypothetical protein
MQLCKLRALGVPKPLLWFFKPRGKVPAFPAAIYGKGGGLNSMRIIELHSPVKLVQRSKGQTATAAAAYRSGTRLECERTGEVHDYTRKQGIELTALLFPTDTPESIQDRQTLWNAAEKREKHPRAQTARDLEVSFPAEFSPEQRREAGLLIGNYLVDNYGVAADLCWHKPDRRGDERNYHLHALFTTRRFEQGDWSKTKDRTLDDLKGKGAEEILKLRQGVADILNNIAARDGLEIYIEHLSFEKRGIDREPTQHLGKYAARLEQRGERSENGDKNREIKARNAEREKLHQEREAIITEIKAAELEAKGQEQSKTSPPSPKISPQMRLSNPMHEFYRVSQSRRQELLKGLETQYGQQEREAKQHLTEFYQAAASRPTFVQIWRKFTGHERKDAEAIRQLQNNLESIQKRKQEAFAAFERERQQWLEVVTKQEQEILTEKVPANNTEGSSNAEVSSEKKNKILAILEQRKQKQAMQQNRGIDLDRG